MFNHVMVGCNDIDRAKKFYDATMVALGHRPGVIDPKGRLFYLTREGSYGVTKPIDGQPATFGNGGTIGFLADSKAMVDAWHKAGIAAGGTAIEDPPGVRRGAKFALYIAYLRDPDGNKVCAVFRLPAD